MKRAKILSCAPEQWLMLRERAKQASEFAYCPYSNFPVGCAILTDTGNVYTGCNVENTCHREGQCAEKSAIGAMIVGGDRTIAAIAIYTPTAKAISPCGGCRQAICEFSPLAEFIAFSSKEKSQKSLAKDLLPSAFSM